MINQILGTPYSMCRSSQGRKGGSETPGICKVYTTVVYGNTSIFNICAISNEDTEPVRISILLQTLEKAFKSYLPPPNQMNTEIDYI